MSGRLKQRLEVLFRRALEACDAGALTRAAVVSRPSELTVYRPTLRGAALSPGELLVGLPATAGRIGVIAVGKAAAGQAAALDQALAVWRGVVVAPAGLATAPSTCWAVCPAAHPVPDETSVAAADAALTLAGELKKDDLLIVAVSGGASAMLAKPAPGLTLGDKAETTRLLLRSGADIVAMNAVRKRLSAVKGGRLAAASAAPTLCLVISDVHDARLDVVGSGPALVDPSSADDARRVIDAHDLWAALPTAVADRLRAAVDEPWPEERPAPQPALLAAPAHLAAAASAAAEAEGLEVASLVESITGPLEEVADEIVADLDRLEPGACRIWVGEPTVVVSGQAGAGGRMSHLALCVAKRITGRDGVAFLACGSDGVDGASSAAGAVVDDKTWNSAQDPEAALAGFDSGRLFAESGAAIVTGPTGTNFTDLMVLARSRDG